jgi:hypothetical protein
MAKEKAPQKKRGRPRQAATKYPRPEDRKPRPKEAKPFGAPTLYRKEYDEQAYNLTLLGLVDRELAAFFHVTEQTLNNWKDDFPSFFESIQNGKEIANGKVAHALFSRATGYTHQVERPIAVNMGQGLGSEVQVVTYTEKLPPDVTAALKFLNCRDPKRWRESKEISLEGNVTTDATREHPIERLKKCVMEFFSRARKVCPLYAKEFITLLVGGRGGGKSYQVADIILATAWAREESGTVVCGREIQKTLEFSSYSLLKDRINYYGLQEDFQCLDNEIRCKKNGVTIIFVGMREATRNDGLKSIHKLFLFWGEEAQGFSQATLDVLIPTLVRVPGCRMIFTMNRQYDSDPVYNEVMAREEESLIIEINYYDNPYITEQARAEAEAMKITNYPKWEHVYGGKPQRVFEDSLWPGDLLKKIVSQVSFSRDNYARVVVCCDPAQTNTEFSNEYGLHVEGLTHGGEGDHIADLSGRMDPNEFSSKAVKAYHDYQADAIIVETNAGGDYIKSAILSIDPTVRVKEVKAKSSQGKIVRALPVANLAQMGKIRHICGGSQKLENQMSRMTNQGFVGAPGESPDRVDAYVWGFIELFGLSDMKTSEMIFKSSMFASAPEKYSIIADKVCYTAIDETVAGGVVFDIIETKDSSFLFVQDYFKCSRDGFSDSVARLLKSGVKEVSIPEGQGTETLVSSLKAKYVGVKTYGVEDVGGKDIGNRVVSVLPLVSQGFVRVSSLPEATYENERGNLFIREITGYNTEDKAPRPILSALCAAIYAEKGL